MSSQRPCQVESRCICPCIHCTGFTISTEVCQKYQAARALPEGLWENVLASLSKVEDAFGAKFAVSEKPLLLSVRSGAGE